MNPIPSTHIKLLRKLYPLDSSVTSLMLIDVHYPLSITILFQMGNDEVNLMVPQQYPHLEF